MPLNAISSFSESSVSTYEQLGTGVRYFAIALLLIHIAFGIAGFVFNQSDILPLRFLCITLASIYSIPEQFLPPRFLELMKRNLVSAAILAGPVFLFCGLFIELTQPNPDPAIIVRRQDQFLGAAALVLFVANSPTAAAAALVIYLSASFGILHSTLNIDYNTLDIQTIILTSAYIALFFIGALVVQRKRREINSKISVLGSLGSSLAHELRTPLMTIRNYAAQIQKPDSPSIASSAANQIMIECDNASTLIDIFLTNAANSYDEAARVFRAKDAIANAIDEYPYRSSRERGCIDFHKLTESEIVGPEILFKHVVLNLIKNSLSNQKLGRFPEISITLEEVKENLVIKFRDNGTGVRNDDLAHIFEPFFSTRNQIGTGIGLAFCRSTINSEFKGTISCESEEGEFTQFTILIPLSSA